MGAKPTALPLPLSTSLTTDAGPPIFYPKPYRHLVGKLLYLNFTRPDIGHAANNLSQFVGNPCELHYEGALYVLEYLKGTIHHGVFYSASSGPDMAAYCDAD